MKIEVSSNFKEFEKHLKRAIDKNGDKGAKNLLKQLTFLFLQLVIPRTPVDTGRARAGWYPAAQRLGLGTGNGNGEGSIEIKLEGKKKYIEITNRVNYIVYLEYGKSKQAPAGMARVSLHDVKTILGSKKWKL